MKTNVLKPKDFAKVYPFSSIFNNAEAESLARRILYYMDDWSDLPNWEKYYDTMTKADKRVASWVKRDFERVLPYLDSPENCAKFCSDWEAIYCDSAKQV